MKCVWVNCDMVESVTGISSCKNENSVIFTRLQAVFVHTMKVNGYVYMHPNTQFIMMAQLN